jgi:hypothetical protein
MYDPINYKNLLILFLNKENEIIKNITGINYIINSDIEEIDTLIGKSEELIKFLSLISDNHLNPWCHININSVDGYNCYKCNYGARHGICDDKNSSYQNIISVIRKKKLYYATMDIKLKLSKFIVDLDDIKKLHNYKTDMLVSYEKLKTF